MTSALLVTPVHAQDGHSGTAGVRTGPELSDLWLFAVGALIVWFVRRTLRNRDRKD